jgi:hypothetical protein
LRNQLFRRRVGPNAAADKHSAQEDDDRHNGDSHEQENKLLPVELDLMERIV